MSLQSDDMHFAVDHEAYNQQRDCIEGNGQQGRAQPHHQRHDDGKCHQVNLAYQPDDENKKRAQQIQQQAQIPGTGMQREGPGTPEPNDPAEGDNIN